MPIEADYEALAVREARAETHRHADKRKAKVDASDRAGELRLIARKCETLSTRADRVGESDLAEDLKTVASFAKKFANKAAR